MSEQSSEAMSDEHGAAISTYKGRKTEASEEQNTYKDGARTAGATATVTDPDMKGPEPDGTERGR